MAKEQVIDEIVEHINDGIEELPPIVEEAAQVLKTQRLGFFAIGVGLGVAAGFAVGYFVMQKRVKTKYEEIANKDIAEQREHYTRLKIALEGEVQSRRPLEELIVERGYSEVEQKAIDEVEEATAEPDPIPGPAQQSIFDGAKPEVAWSYATEVKSRTPDVPYIIHIDEFKQNEPEHEQYTYTYYEMDDALVGDHDQVIEDMDAVIGLGNLGRWGHGSGDPHIVYIRNEELTMDLEVIRDRGSYAEETGRHLRHESGRRRRPNRGFDDD